MLTTIAHVTADAADPFALATWWTGVLGGRVGAGDRPGDPEVSIVGVDLPLLFVEVPDRKVVKNRMHLCLQPEERSRNAEVDRILALGATLVDDLRHPDGTGWAVLADPEGNEFCVLRSSAERARAVTPT